MSKLSKNTVKALVTLLAEGEIKVRELTDKTLADRLVSSECLKRERLTRSSSRFVLVSEKGLRICCADFDERLKDIEGYYRTLEEGNSRLKPSEEIAKYGRDHHGKRNLWRGFFLKSNTQFQISYNGQTYTIGPDNPFLVDKVENLEVDCSACSLWVVENYECFQDLSWMKLFHGKNRVSLIICRWPASKAAREAYGNWPVAEKHYFGALDLAGINIFQTEYADNFGNDSLFVPDSFKEDIKHGSTSLFQDQIKFKHISGRNSKIQDCIQFIIENQKGLLQEYYLAD